MSDDQVLKAPAPWLLDGVGYVLIYKFKRQIVDDYPLPFPRELGKFRLGLGAVMLVDYQQSNAGPYHELLLMPGYFQFGKRVHPSITKIYVSTRESIVNGRANWGIPKEHADFQVQRTSDGTERIQVSKEGHTFVDLTLKERGFEIPITTALAPGYFKKVQQPYEGQHFLTQLGGKGRMKSARLLEAKVDGDHFPRFDLGRLITAVKVTRFQLEFPVPRIWPWE